MAMRNMAIITTITIATITTTVIITSPTTLRPSPNIHLRLTDITRIAIKRCEDRSLI